MSWYIAVLRNYAGFSGRARRSEYWMFTLFNIIILMTLLFGISIVSPEIGGLAYMIYALGTLIPSLAVLIRRLHDTNKSGWMCLISLIPVIGGIWLLILLVQDGTQGPNDYGEDPKA